MNKFQNIFVGLLIADLAMFANCARSENAPAQKPEVKSESKISEEFKPLMNRIQEKLQNGKKSESDFTQEISDFDKLLDKYKDDKSDDVAQVYMMKGMLYTQVLNEPEKGIKVLEQVKKTFPDSKYAARVDDIVAATNKQVEGKKIQADLVAGKKFPNFEEKDLEGKPLSVSGYKGKVVLVDFWATWCGPCVGELPNVIKTYENHHKDGFEIVGISLDQSEAKLKAFLKEHKMTWQQYFDGKGWENKISSKYGVMSIPATFLLDRDGNILGRDLRGEELEAAVKKALEKKA